MPKWLNCTISKGMFSDEWTVVVRDRNGENISVFVPRDSTDTAETETGRVKVCVVEQSGHALAILPDEYQTVVDVNASDLVPA